MLDHLLPEPYEIEFARLASATLHILARDMDDAFRDLSLRAGGDTSSHHHHAAQAAEQVALLCGRLCEAIGCFLRYDSLRRIDEIESSSPSNLRRIGS